MLKKFYGYIYLIQNIQNNKVYIGKTADKNPIKYVNDHFASALRKKDKTPNGKYLYNAIRKYGKENFKCKILGKITSRHIRNLNKKINEAEIECILFFRSFGSDGEHQDEIYGYNQTKGGDGTFGYKKSEESKIKTGSKCRGELNYRYGKKDEDIWQGEELEGIKKSRSHIGENNPMYGKSLYSIWIKKYGKEEADKRQIEYNLNMSKSTCNEKNGMYGKHHTEKTRQIISKKLMGHVIDPESTVKRLQTLEKNKKEGKKRKPYSVQAIENFKKGAQKRLSK